MLHITHTHLRKWL